MSGHQGNLSIMNNPKTGDVESFDQNWNQRAEALYTHWTREHPANQIQLAFRNHWTLFNELMSTPGFNKGRRVLEVGCGRGSLSCYFSDAGYDCTLLDLSPKVISIAEAIFSKNGLNAKFEVGDACRLPYADGAFDLVFSIGLLEHFDDIETPIREQVRILAPGGLFIGYVVPKYTDNIQKGYDWINGILKGYAGASEQAQVAKEQVFRSDHGSERYLPLLEKHCIRNPASAGVYPLPMISHSIDFPFTLMPPTSESALVAHLESMLEANRQKTGRHPWLCEEGFGQAFLVWGVRA
jgi:SAM-dependent methyltransferase